MDQRQALSAFAALSQDTRLRIVRMLVKAGPDGMAAGAVAQEAEVSNSNVSFHLKELEIAGLIKSRREARSIIYSAAYESLSGLIQFLMKDCCAGHPEICAPALAQNCCTPAPIRKRKKSYA
ncbi:ArsR/SmtB family transcription factor [Pseudorhodoplanes sp.]|uniref:ArsR/SmtB family transcription factor n=1 Tax=Pseudorhodoplanes sp. TaxID=1934341 RepID=UPI003D12A87E